MKWNPSPKMIGRKVKVIIPSNRPATWKTPAHLGCVGHISDIHTDHGNSMYGVKIEIDPGGAIWYYDPEGLELLDFLDTDAPIAPERGKFPPPRTRSIQRGLLTVKRKERLV